MKTVLDPAVAAVEDWQLESLAQDEDDDGELLSSQSPEVHGSLVMVLG